MKTPRTPHSASVRPLSTTDPQFVQQFDLYRLRSEENERNFMSLRTLEWQVPFQVYAASGAVVATFYAIKVDKSFGMSIQSVAVLAIVILAIVFAAAVFWQVQVVHRLHFNRAMQQAYLVAMHDAVCEQLPIPADTSNPRFQGWWAFLPMQVMNFVAFAAATIFILNATPACG